MEKIIYFDISALMLLIVVFITLFYRKMTKGMINKTFMYAMTIVFVASIANIGAIYYDNLGPGNYNLKLIFHTLYLLFHTLSALGYFTFLISLTDTWFQFRKRKIEIVVLLLPIVIYFIFLIINLGTPLVFSIDRENNDTYTRLFPYFYLGYIVGGLYMIMGIVYIVKHRQIFSLSKLITIFSPYPLILLSMLIEFKIPIMCIELFVNALALMFVSNSIQHSEELLDEATGFSNASAYENICKKATINRKDFTLIIADIQNFKKAKDILPYDGMVDFRKACGIIFRKINKEYGLKAEICYLKNGTFVLFVDSRFNNIVDNACDALCEALNQQVSINTYTIKLRTSVFLVRVPEDLDKVHEWVNLYEEFSGKYEAGIVHYASEIFDDKKNRMLLIIDHIMDRAWKDGNFSMYYQPIYSIEQKRFTSCEALMRLYDEQYGYISPEIFIPAAERNGMIIQLGNFALEDACRFIASKDFKRLGIEYVDVNLSVAQCLHRNLIGIINGISGKYGVLPEQLNLEITETAMGGSDERVLKNIKDLHDMGYGISLDDFGSGYSNFQRITSLPVDIIKLDKSFVHLDSTKSIALRKSMINLINVMDAKVVVEGVETGEDVVTMTDLGCDYIQGYYYARPLPKKEFFQYVLECNENKTKWISQP